MKRILFSLVILAGLSFTATGAINEFVRPNIYLQEKQYKKIDVAEVSKQALDKIKKSYGEYTIKEAFRADDGEYKLVLTKDGVNLIATFTAAGDLIKIIN